jgi:hypothetical protein
LRSISTDRGLVERGLPKEATVARLADPVELAASSYSGEPGVVEAHWFLPPWRLGVVGM